MRGAAGLVVLLTAGGGCETAPPCPPSEIASGIEWNWAARTDRAVGSDNWALTWAGEDTHFTTWGDGGGFGGDNSRGRVSLGVARITGGPDDFTARNVWGGVEAETRPTFEGKSYGILAAGDRLWMWVTPDSDAEGYAEARLAVSDDDGRSWTRLDWAITAADRLAFPAFVQYGPERPAAGAELAYACFVEIRGEPDELRVQRPGRLHLARADVARLGERDAWRFHAGLDGNGEPRWVPDPAASVPVFEDPEGVGWCVSLSRHPGLDRYVLVTEHGKTFRGRLGFFEAPRPWGPWRTIEYTDGWGPDDLPRRWFYGNLAPGWNEGDAFVFVATGIRECDRWMSVRGRFVRR